MRNACNDSDMGVGNGLTAALESLFLTSGVDLVLAGHYHLYQRLCPLRNGTCAGGNTGLGRGIPHITVGSAGATTHNESIALGYEGWVESYIPLQWGWGVVSIANRSALKWEFMGNDGGGGDGVTVLDSVWYYK